jgi:hypothetical protein
MIPLPAADPCAQPSNVMLLSLWGPPATPWHAKLVGADAQVHEFDSPFELARFVAQPACASPAATALPTRGLR